MAATSQSQHRCVFGLGNIPYDATEEQLVQICEEVGPVVSFRLVIDRETGKPKGYGFCEYKDEETALSARRNLQGYEINGRQLRVDFAENDKNSDRNRVEQGRGGPGTVPNVGLGNQNLNLPMGDSVSIAAATVMAGALGSAQTASMRNQIGLQSQSLMGTDPLTRHLAQMSRSQLTEVISEVKAMATQDKERARNILLAIPNLPKALFQAEIMLGLVSQQVLMTPSTRQSSAQPTVPMVQSAQTLPGLPPLQQNKVPMHSYAQDTRVSSEPNQYAVVEQLPAQLQTQRLPPMQSQVLQPSQLQVQPGVPSLLPSIHSQQIGHSVGTNIHVPASSTSSQQAQHPLTQTITTIPPLKSGYNDHSRSQNGSTHPSVVYPQFSTAGIQEKVDLKGHSANVHGKRMLSHSIDQVDVASKLMKLNDGRVSPLQTMQASAQLSIPFPISGIPPRQDSRVEAANPEKQATQIQLPPYVNSALRQQVLDLKSEQLGSLTPDQQQQLFQLQQMLRQAT